MDEYNRLPDEFHVHADEYNRKTVKQFKPKKKKRNNYKAIKCLFASSMVLLTYPVYFDVLPKAENKPVEENAVIKDDVNNNHNTVSEIIENNLVSDNQSPNETVQPPAEEIKTVMVEIECDLCEGTGIICPGDPTFGYDRGNGHGYEGCHGTGYSICPDIWCHDGIKTCQNCEGSGIYKGETCQVCEGSGIVDCEFCHNTGIAECISADSHSPCEKCEGKGYYLEERIING